MRDSRSGNTLKDNITVTNESSPEPYIRNVYSIYTPNVPIGRKRSVGDVSGGGTSISRIGCDRTFGVSVVVYGVIRLKVQKDDTIRDPKTPVFGME